MPIPCTEAETDMLEEDFIAPIEELWFIELANGVCRAWLLVFVVNFSSLLTGPVEIGIFEIGKLPPPVVLMFPPFVFFASIEAVSVLAC